MKHIVFILAFFWACMVGAQPKSEVLDTTGGNGKVYIIRTVTIKEEVPDSADLYDRRARAVAARVAADSAIAQADRAIRYYRRLNRPLARPARRSVEAPPDVAPRITSIPDSLPSTVIRAVHDGDSYYLVGMLPANKFSRAVGYDAPEIKSPYVSATQPYGVEIGDSVRLLLKGKRVEYYLYGLDKYNRPLVTLEVEGRDLGEIILAKGWAWYYSPNDLPSAMKTRYKKLEREAKKAKRGLWAAPDPVKPWEWRKKYPPVTPSK